LVKVPAISAGIEFLRKRCGDFSTLSRYAQHAQLLAKKTAELRQNFPPPAISEK
jgi:hypothetical protein